MYSKRSNNYNNKSRYEMEVKMLKEQVDNLTNMINSVQTDYNKITEELTSLRANIVDNKIQTTDPDYHPSDNFDGNLVRNTSYRHLYGNLISAFEPMSVGQLKNVTTKLDTSYIGDKCKRNKDFYIYSVLTTIARKALQEKNKDIEFIMESRHKLTDDVITNILDNVSNIQPEWLLLLSLHQKQVY